MINALKEKPCPRISESEPRCMIIDRTCHLSSIVVKTSLWPWKRAELLQLDCRHCVGNAQQKEAIAYQHHTSSLFTTSRPSSPGETSHHHRKDPGNVSPLRTIEWRTMRGPSSTHHHRSGKNHGPDWLSRDKSKNRCSAHSCVDENHHSPSSSLECGEEEDERWSIRYRRRRPSLQ